MIYIYIYIGGIIFMTVTRGSNLAAIAHMRHIYIYLYWEKHHI